MKVDAAEYVAKRFAGRKAVTSSDVVRGSRKPRYVSGPLEALNILYALVATDRAKIDTRFREKRLYFNVSG